MIDEGSLIVPIVVEALVLNTQTRGYSVPGYGFQRYSMEYSQLQQFENAWWSQLLTGFSTGSAEYYNGVYLKWRLPAALTVAPSGNDEVNPPLVPNRWMVVRYWEPTGSAPRQATAWIVESDAPGKPPETGATYSDEGSMYVTSPHPNKLPDGMWIGRNVPLSEPWREPGGAPYLTAVAPGNPAFAIYQPFCNNVFSFFDPLNSLESAQPLTYCVIGWYSDPGSDPLAGGAASQAAFDALLASLNWTIAGPDFTTTSPDGRVASSSLYSGFVTGVRWQTESPGPMGAPAETIGVAFAPTSAQALTNLITAQGGGDLQPELLAAMQLNALHILDQPDGDITLNQLILGAEFQKSFGGYVWSVADAASPYGSPSDSPPGSPGLELALLDRLNETQSQLDEQLRLLAAGQAHLYDLWFAWGFQKTSAFHLAGPSPNYYLHVEPLLRVDPENLDSTPAGRIVSRRASVDALALQVQELSAMLRAIPGVDLRRGLLTPFYVPNEPVVLLSNAGASGIVGNSPLPLPCRFPTQLVTGLTCSGSTIAAAPPPLPCGSPYLEPPAGAIAVDVPLPSNLCTVSGVPWSVAEVVSLLDECFFLDPNNADTLALDPAVAAAGLTSDDLQGSMEDPSSYATGTLPFGFFAGGSPPQQQWTVNPWHPLVVAWQGNYGPIEYAQPSGTPSWTFTLDGYSPSTGITPSGVVVLSGQVLLTPAAAVNFQSQIQALTADPGSSSPAYAAELTGLQNLQQFVKTNDRWDLVSQALDGFNEQLLLRSTGVYPHPLAYQPPGSPSVADLAGNAIGYVPNMNGARFAAWRSGSFELTNLAVIDEWGQALTLLDDGETGKVSLHPATVPGPILIPPTLLQPARLTFDLIGGIRGWIVPNLLDRSLLVYDPGGDLLGEVAVDAAGDAAWTPFESGSPPVSPSVGDPYFAEFLQSLNRSGALLPFIDAVDATASTIASAEGSFNQNLALLVGRPLAFVRAQLQFELDGPPDYAPTWTSLLAPPPSPAPVTTYPFSVGLGNPDQAQDGLIGYFVDDEYGQFNVIDIGQSSNDTGYLNQIGAEGNWINLTFGAKVTEPATANPSAIVSMIIDPRFEVHAVSGILPVQTISIPPKTVTAALEQMNVTFRVNTILTDQPAPGTVAMPTPSQAGTWSWIESLDGDPYTSAVAPVNPNALLPDTLPVLRRGLLQLAAPFSSP